MDPIGEVSGAGKECYPGTNIERPNQLDGGGRGTYCCVPECKSAHYNHLLELSHIGIFTLPKNNPTKKQWIRLLKNVRRKGPSDDFDPTSECASFIFPSLTFTDTGVEIEF